MSINTAHWTDKQVSEFCQPLMDEALDKLGDKNRLSVVATTFFLNPKELGCTTEPSSMEPAIHRKLRSILPRDLVEALPPTMARGFMGLADLGFSDGTNFHLVLSRPDDEAALARTIYKRTNITPDDLVTDPTAKSFGYDNLDLMSRIFQVFNCLPNGGLARVKALGGLNLVKYRSTLGARRKYLENGGDTEIITIHEAAAHVGAFTTGKISHEYMGFMRDFEFSDKAVEFVYGRILNRLVEKGYTTKESKEGISIYASTPVQNLLVGLSELLDGYENQISASGGTRFSAFHTGISLGEADERIKERVGMLSGEEFIETTEHFIVYQALKGLKTLMGENTMKYMPERNAGSYDRINKLLTHRYS